MNIFFLDKHVYDEYQLCKSCSTTPFFKKKEL